MKKNYLLSSILGAMLFAMPVSADVVSMRTSIPVGEKLSLALNENVKATLTWGNGEKETINFDGSEVEITVKHESFSLESEQGITHLFCPDCGLTDLVLDLAPNMMSVICPDNELQSLDLQHLSKLTELNCENNKLSTLSFTKNTNLETLNFSNNEIAEVSVSGLTKLKSLLCANNNLKKLLMYSQKELESLWCQGNEIEKISFEKSAQPDQICAYNNKLDTLSARNLEGIKELWVDNNELRNLDLSHAFIEELSASNNQLANIVWNIEDKREGSLDVLRAFYADGNALTINSLPTVYDATKQDTLIAYNIDNMRPFHALGHVNLNERVNFQAFYRVNGWDKHSSAKLVFKNQQGEDLMKGVDYKLSGSTYTFLKGQRGVVGELTSKYYPNVVFRTEKFSIIDPTGIEELNGADALQVSANGNVLQVNASKSALVKVYNVSGVSVVNETVTAGSHSWNLPAGLYIVNGKKVVLGN